jgi:hypothetical protein
MQFQDRYAVFEASFSAATTVTVLHMQIRTELSNSGWKTVC